MARRPWVQPALEGGAIRAFRIKATFRWPMGWEATCEIQQEGWHSGWIEVSKLLEGETRELAVWLELVGAFCADANERN